MIEVMVNHCEENHRDMCNYLLVLSDVQLLEMAHRLDACANEWAVAA